MNIKNCIVCNELVGYYSQINTIFQKLIESITS